MGLKIKIMTRKISIALLLGAVAFLASCSGEATVDQNALEAKVNQEVATKTEQLQADYTSNCETRMSTEIKRLTDSVVNARQIAASAQ